MQPLPVKMLAAAMPYVVLHIVPEWFVADGPMEAASCSDGKRGGGSVARGSGSNGRCGCSGGGSERDRHLAHLGVGALGCGLCSGLTGSGNPVT